MKASQFRKYFLQLAFSIWLIFCSTTVFAQDSLPPIPHKTLHDKWMWPHRLITRIVTKERKPFFDTTYIRSFKKYIIITVPLSTRFLNFQITDWRSANHPTLQYATNQQYDLGISLNSRWATFLMNTGVTLFNKDNDTKGKTKQTDYQFNVYGKRFTTDASLQLYQGYYIKNSSNFKLWDSIKTSQQPYSIRSDAQAFSVSIGTYYVFNYKKFSYRNSFAFTETQLKSAGSFLVGGYWSLLSISGDSSLVKYPFASEIDPNAYIKSGAALTFGINIGYIYTVVIKKKFYITFSAIPGFGLTRNTYIRSDSSNYVGPVSGNYKVNLRTAIGYDNGKFFFGTMGMTDYYYYSSESNATFDYSYGKARIYVGYRFNVRKAEKKLLTKLGLIDWDKKKSN
ncbi:MAG: DUF4421 family protein [Bacteroidota bacterium]